MNPFVTLLKELKEINSVKDKEIILQKYKDDEYSTELIKRALDPYQLFYIKKLAHFNKAKYVPDDALNHKDRYDFFIGLTNDLTGRYITGNEAKEATEAVFSMFPEEEYEAYRKVLLKEAVGVGATTVNKVWPKLVPVFSVMLASNEMPQLPNQRYPLMVQPKLDGMRAIYMHGNFWTRSGIIFPNVKLDEYFKSLKGHEDNVLDGELYIHNQPFQKLASTLNADDAPIPNGLRYVVYDAIPKDEWVAQKCNLTYQARLEALRGVVNSVADHKKVIDISSDVVYDAGEVVELYKKYLKDGYEGVMLKDPNGHYKWGRCTLKSGTMIKLKPFKSIDLTITGIYDGEGKYEGKAGGLLADHAGVTIRIGSGFSDADRSSMAAQPHSYIGKTVEVKYFEETEDGSLRFPIFERIRTDK